MIPYDPDFPRLSDEALEYAARLFSPEVVDLISKLDHRLGGCYTAANWLSKANYHFGGLRPIELIMMGRGKTVREFVLNAGEDDLP